MESERILMGKLKNLEKNLSQCHFVYKSHSNLVHGEKSVTDCLSHGMTSHEDYYYS
jgi:hypothetical protein